MSEGRFNRDDPDSSFRKCPCCGDTDLMEVYVPGEISIFRGKECCTCGAVWVPPIRKWLAVLFLLCSPLLLVISVVVGSALVFVLLSPCLLNPILVASFLFGCYKTFIVARSSIDTIRNGTGTPNIVVEGRSVPPPLETTLDSSEG